jgi:hypothetical protein
MLKKLVEMAIIKYVREPPPPEPTQSRQSASETQTVTTKTRKEVIPLQMFTSENFDNSNRFLTPADFARHSGWSYKITLKLAKTKGFPSFKPLDGSNRYLIDVEGIPGWIDIQKKKPKPNR